MPAKCSAGFPDFFAGLGQVEFVVVDFVFVQRAEQAVCAFLGDFVIIGIRGDFYLGNVDVQIGQNADQTVDDALKQTPVEFRRFNGSKQPAVGQQREDDAAARMPSRILMTG